MNNSINLNGKVYVSSRHAAQLMGYATDYVGQLCRSGKLDCTRIGRVWFVTHESIAQHKLNSDLNLAAQYAAQKTYAPGDVHHAPIYGAPDSGISRMPIPIPPPVIFAASSSVAATASSISYFPDSGELLPPLKKGKAAGSLHHAPSASKLASTFSKIAGAKGSAPHSIESYFTSGLSQVILSSSLIASMVFGVFTYSSAISSAASTQNLSQVAASIEKNPALLSASVASGVGDIFSSFTGGLFEKVNTFLGNNNVYGVSGETNVVVADDQTTPPSSQAPIAVDTSTSTASTPVSNLVSNSNSTPVHRIVYVPITTANSIASSASPRASNASNINGSSGGESVVAAGSQPIILSNVTSSDLEQQIQDLSDQFTSELNEKLAGLSTGGGAAGVSNPISNVYAEIASSQNIGQLSGTAITNPSVSGGSITGTTISNAAINGTVNATDVVAGNLSVSGNATSTFLGDATFDTDTLTIDSINHRVGIATTSPSDTFALNGDFYLGPTIAPSVPQDRLYNNAGTLYWDGAPVGGGGSSQWTTSGPSIYYSSGSVGIGTTSPTAALSVGGSGYFGNNVEASNFTATSSTASIFQYASTTAITVSGTASTSNLIVSNNATVQGALGVTGATTLGSLNGALQAINGLVSATSTLSVAYGGVGLSTAPAYGQILLGNASGGYTLTATSSLGILSGSTVGAGTQGEVSFYNAPGSTLVATSSLFIGQNGNVGIGTSSPSAQLSVQGNALFSGNISSVNLTATGIASTTNLIASNSFTLANVTGALQAINGLVSATSTLSTAYGGTGVNTAPAYGQILLGNASGGYSLSATSSLGFLASTTIALGTQGQVPYYGGTGNTLTATSSFFVAQNGNVGIGDGTTTPAYVLDLQGDVGTGGGNLFEIHNTDTGVDNRAIMTFNAGGTTANIDALRNGGFAFSASTLRFLANYGNGGDAMDITPNGYVGIGSSTPLATLSVSGNSYITGSSAVKYLTNASSTSFNAYGDSITVGNGASSSNFDYANTIASTLGMAVNNESVSGSVLQDPGEADNIWGTAVGTTTISTLLPGYNNMREYGTSTTALANYNDALLNDVVYMAIPDANKTYASAATLGGTWTATSTYSQTGRSEYATAIGSTATFTLTGNTVYLGGTRASSGGGAMDIIIDGTDYGTESCNNANITLLSSRPYSQFLFRVPNLANGSHTVVAKVTSPGYCEVDWGAGNAGASLYQGPYVYLANTLRMTSAGYALDGPSENLGSDPIVWVYDSIDEQVAKEVAEDGLQVEYVDAADQYNPNTMVSGDSIHPGNVGHAAIAQAFIQKMSLVPQLNEREATPFLDANTPKFSLGILPNVLTFDTVNGLFGVGTTSPWGQLSVSTNNASGPAFTVGSSTNTDLIVANSGYVGIGTSTPIAPLTVQDSNALASQIIASNGDAALKLIADNAGRGLIIFPQEAAGTTSSSFPALQFNSLPTDSVIQSWSNSNNAAVNPLAVQAYGGQTSINTLTPTAELTVGTTTAGGGALPMFNVTNSSATTLFNVLGNGDVGIGTSSPAALLDIAGGNVDINYNQSYGSRNSVGNTASLAGLGVGTFGIGNGQSNFDLLASTNNTNGWQIGGSGEGLSGSGVGSVDAISFDTNSSEAMRLTSAGDLGIGTTTPQQALSVVGDETIGTTGTDRISMGDAGIALAFNRNVSNGQIFNSNAYAYQLTHNDSNTSGSDYLNWNVINPSGSNASTNILVLNSNGKVGIGTTTPQSKLAVSGNASIGADYDLAAPTNGLAVEGNVGIGTTSPSAIFDITTGTSKDIYEGLAANTSFNIISLNESNSTDNGLESGGDANLYVDANQSSGSALVFRTNANERARITGAGFFGIGTSSPYAEVALQVTGGGSTPLFAIASSTNGAATSTPFSILGNGLVGIGTSSPSAQLSVQGNALFSGNISSANLTATGTASTTNLIASNSFTLANVTGALQAINGLVSASSTLSVAYGGTGTSTAPAYGQILLGNASGGYTLTATSSLGLLASSAIAAGTQGQVAFYNSSSSNLTATSSIFVAQNGNVGISTTSPFATLSVSGSGYFAGNLTASIINATSTTATSTFSGAIQGGSLSVNGGSRLGGGLSSSGVLVSAGPYDVQQTGGANFGPSSGQTSVDWMDFGQTYRIRQNGTVQQVKMYIPNTTGITHLYLDIWRVNSSGTYDLVGTSTDLVSQLVSGPNTFTVSPGVPALEGDYIGGEADYSSASAQNFYIQPYTYYNQVNSNTVVNTYSVNNAALTGAATIGYNWGTQTASLNQAIYEEVDMSAPIFVALGDSVMSGHPLSHSFIDAYATTSDQQDSIPYGLGHTLNYTYQNMGISGETTGNFASRVTTDVVNEHPQFAVLEGGNNDLLGSGTVPSIEANWVTILTAVHNAGITPVILGILPFRSYGLSTNTMASQVDQINAYLQSIASTYGGVYINAAPYVGEYYPTGPTGNLWQLQPQYSYDGIHMSAAGYARVAQAISDGMNATTVQSGGILSNISINGDVTLSGSAPKRIFIDRNPLYEATGTALTLQAGGASQGASNINGGNLVLSSGIVTGTGTSMITLNIPNTSAVSGASDNLPIEGFRLESPSGQNGEMDTRVTAPSGSESASYFYSGGTFEGGIGYNPSGNTFGLFATSTGGIPAIYMTTTGALSVGISATTTVNGGLLVGTSGTAAAKESVFTSSDGSPTNYGTTKLDSRMFTVGSIGSSPSVLAITKNTVSGGSSYISSFTAGTSWDPIGFDANSYNFYLSGSTSTASTPLAITSGGSVGIGGTTTPNATLEVYGSTPSSGLSSNPNFQIGSTGSSLLLDIGTYTGGYAFMQSKNTSNAAQPFLINPNGGVVGIGTTTPQSKLAVSGGESVGADYDIAAPTNGLLVEGNVGIGTTSPVATLSMQGSIGVSTTQLYLAANGFVGAGLNNPQTSLDAAGPVRSQGSGAAYLTSGSGAEMYLNGSTAIFDGYNRSGSSALDANLGATIGSLIVKGAGTMLNNVGIGTTTPQQALSVVGDETIGTTGTDRISMGDAGIALAFNRNVSNGQIFNSNAYAYQLTHNDSNTSGSDYLNWNVINPSGSNASTNILVLNSNGKVGIGTTTPQSKLAVSGNASIGADYDLAAPTNGLAVEGNVGIGTTSPSAIFDITTGTSKDIYEGLAANTSFNIISLNESNSTDNGLESGGDANLYVDANQSSGSALVFRTNANERARITGAGFFGIGTSSPYAEVALQVTGGGSTPLFAIASSTNGAATSTPFSILGNGLVGIGTTSPWRTLSVNGKSDLGVNALAGSFTATSTATSTFAGGFTVGSSQFLVQQATGNVGIGVVNPAQTLEVDGTVQIDSSGSGNYALALPAADGSGSTDAGWIGGGNRNLIGLTSTGHTMINAAGLAGGDIEFVTNGEESSLLATILNNGNLGIGTTTPGVMLGVGGLMDIGGTGTSTIENNLYVEGTLRSHFSYVGDLIFGNEFRFVEGVNGTSTNTLLLNNQFGANLFDIDQNGDLGLGTTSPAFKLQVIGNVGAQSFVATSAASSTTDVSYLTATDDSNILDEIDGVDVARYRYDTEDPAAPVHLGLIAEQAPSAILSLDANGNPSGIDLYQFTTFTLAGLQAEDAKVSALTVRVSALEAEFASSTESGASVNSGSLVSTVVSAFQSLGTDIEQGFAHFISVIADNLTVGSAAEPTGITLYDKTTGAPYCLSIVSGTTETNAGACAPASSASNEASVSGSSAPSSLSGSGSDSSDGSGTATSTGPVITINGNNPAMIALASTYEDLGASVQDGVSPDIGVTTTGTVNTNVLGTYTLTYTATDQDGLTATSTRQVIVYDPNIQSGTASSTAATSTPSDNSSGNSGSGSGASSPDASGSASGSTATSTATSTASN